jgi:AcrR family transcriptional regulator
MTVKMDDDGATGLPASIEAAWGLRGRPTKGPKPGLTLDRIVAAAVNIAVTDGLAAVSMSRIAADLGAATMSLYRYVSAKDELLELMIDAAIGVPPEPPAPDRSWRAGLSRWAWAERAVFQKHTWALQVPVSGPPITPNQIAWLEQGLMCLRDTGLAEDEKLSVILLLSGFVRNEVTLFSQMAEAHRASGTTPDEMMLSYGRTLARLMDHRRFPAVSRMITSGVADQADDPDKEFIFGLDRILDGVEALVRTRK